MKITTKETLNSRYIVAEAAGAEKKESFSVSMLKNARIDSLLKFDTETLDGKTSYYYDITSLTPIKKVFTQRNMNSGDFENLIRSISSLAQNLKNYLLDINDVLFDTRVIFMDSEEKYYFCLIPDAIKTIKPRFSEFCDNLISLIDYSDQKTVTYCFKLNRLSKNENLSFASLSRLFDLEKNEDTPPVQSDIPEASPLNTDINSEKLSELVPEKGKKNKHTKKVPAKDTYTSKDSTSSSDLSFSERAKIYLDGKSFSDVLSDLNSGKIFRKVRSAEPKVTYQFQESSSKKSEKSRSSLTPSAKKDTESINYSDIFQQDDSAGIAMEEVSYNVSPDKTTDLGHLYEREHVLFGENGSAFELSHFPFTLGRLKGEVDCRLNSPDISRIHGRLSMNNDNEVFYEDLNSTNKSFINGVQLRPYIKSKLSSGDTLTLADTSFTFR